MTRRFRLFLVATFVVLLGIPVVYVAVAWNPGENPLRFRIVEVKENPWPDNPSSVKVRVENTSSVPIYLMMAVFHPRRDMTGMRIFEGINPQSGDNEHLADNAMIPIPARSSLDCTGYVYMQTFKEEQPKGGNTFRYDWVSKPKAVAIKFTSWLVRNTPERLHLYIPSVERHIDETTLEPPPARE